MTLWELAKRILYRDSHFKARFHYVAHVPRKPRVSHQVAREGLRDELAGGICNDGASDDAEKDLFETEEDFWNDYHDYEGSMRSQGENTVKTDNQGQLIIYTGWYRWADGSIRSTPEKS